MGTPWQFSYDMAVCSWVYEKVKQSALIFVHEISQLCKSACACKYLWRKKRSFTHPILFNDHCLDSSAKCEIPTKYSRHTIPFAILESSAFSWLLKLSKTKQWGKCIHSLASKEMALPPIIMNKHCRKAAK